MPTTTKYRTDADDWANYFSAAASGKRSTESIIRKDFYSDFDPAYMQLRFSAL